MNNSNFYLKARLFGEGDAGDEIRIPIEDTIFSKCAVCGAEHKFSLAELHRDRHFDVTTSMRCANCVKLMQEIETFHA